MVPPLEVAKALDKRMIQITPGDNFNGSYQMWSFKPEQREQPAMVNLGKELSNVNDHLIPTIHFLA